MMSSDDELTDLTFATKFALRVLYSTLEQDLSLNRGSSAEAMRNASHSLKQTDLGYSLLPSKL